MRERAQISCNVGVVFFPACINHIYDLKMVMKVMEKLDISKVVENVGGHAYRMSFLYEI